MSVKRLDENERAERSRRHRADRELLQRVAARDTEAATFLFDRHSEEIFGFLARRVGRIEAEDFLQEVFSRALRRASTFRGESTARTWLFAIARYVLLERSRDRIHPTEDLELVESGPGPESLLLTAERRAHLLCALERLPDDQAIVFELHRIDGLQHEEIAQMLGIRVATSRKRLQRAIAALEQTLRAGPSDTEARHQHLESWAHSLRMRKIELESPR